MSERVDIANMALNAIGEQEITSLEDDSDRARVVKTNYIPARDATLEAHEWSFAIERFIPAKLEEDPAYGASNLFALPSNILRVIAVERNDNMPGNPWVRPINSKEQVDWVLEGRKIVCNEDAIYCRGIRRVEDEGIFSPLFVTALAQKLAALIALPLASSIEMQGHMETLYDRKIHEAKSRDGLQGRSKRIRNRSLLKSR